MAATPASRRKRGGLRRGTLTPDRIVTESLRLLDTGGVAGFSMPKLGRALGADPTAVYRHFASKDDLVLAIADRLIEEAMDGLPAHDCWVETVIDSTRRLRRTYLAHPAAASLSSFRTTGRPAEMRVVDRTLEAVMAAGYEGLEAAVIYRALGDFALAWCGSEAALLALPQLPLTLGNAIIAIREENNRLFADRREPVWDRRIDRDRVTRLQHVLLEPGRLADPGPQLRIWLAGGALASGRRAGHAPARRRISAVIAGTTWCRSPMTA